MNNIQRWKFCLDVIKKRSNTIFILLIVSCLISLFIIRDECKQLITLNEVLSVTVNNQTTTIETLKAEMESTNSYINQLEQENKSLKSQLKNNTQTNSSGASDFKSFMSYTTITDKTSEQWQLQQKAATNQNGLRCINGKPLVAIGTGWHISVGETATVYMDNGNTFDIIIGDIKDNTHTDNTNKITKANGCMVEFIVDTTKLPQTVQISGNLSSLKQYNGVVIKIVKK